MATAVTVVATTVEVGGDGGGRLVATAVEVGGNEIYCL